MNNKSITHVILVCIPMALIGLGIIMIYSSSSLLAAQKYHDSAYFLKKQLVFGLCGIIGMLAMMRISSSTLRRYAYLWWGGSIVLLGLVLVPGLGVKAGGAVRWLHVGPFTFQPAELAKLAVIIALACSLSKKDPERIKTFSVGVVPHLLIALPVCALILIQPDFGTAAMLAIVVFIMLFVAGIHRRYLVGMVAVATIAGACLVVHKGYRLERWITFLNPWKDPTGSGFQIIQSFLAFGSGGLTGTGLGKGYQKLYYLPEPHTDFILSVIGEELGFVGVIVVIALFALLIGCGIRIAMQCYDPFCAYVAFGIVVLIGVQTVLNMGVVTGLLPTKGMPLPFVSYGGSALLSHQLAIGILVNMSSQPHVTARS
ncbi:MAG: putative lipid II flippase FtsW [Desulfobacterota bacterium]|nr:putative lipid II flippase FtsW [Thermodesulfobacteriota bacterium]